MQVPTLQRFTTEYIEREDRLRLTGDLGHGDAVVLWLTQRLLNRLVPHLCQWLERHGAQGPGIPSVQTAHQDILHGFAQQAARAQLPVQPPVRASSAAASWRVDSVDIAQREDVVTLTFKAEGKAQATLTLAAQPLRQWLGIVFEQYQRGDWPATIWPGWMEAAAPKAAPGPMALH